MLQTKESLSENREAMKRKFEASGSKKLVADLLIITHQITIMSTQGNAIFTC